MKHISFDQYNKYVAITILLIIIILSYFIIKPFIIPVLGSIVLAYLFNPLYIFFNKRIKNSSVSAALIIIILILIVAIPLFFVINSLVKEAIEINGFIREHDIYSKVLEIKYIPGLIDKATQYIISVTSKFIISIPTFFLNIFIMFFTLFYLLTQGRTLLKGITDRIPLEEHQKKHLFDKFEETVHALFYGIIITGVIQGIITSIAFYIFNVRSPVLFGIIVLIFAILPAVGAGLVWIPAGLIKVLTGNLFDGIGILIVGLLLITPIEMILKPKLIGKKSSLHPLAILFGVIGGVELMGFIGIIYGPLILLIAITLIKFIEETKNIKITI